MSLSNEGASQTNIHNAQFQFGRLLRKINDRITSGDDSKSILDFLFDSLDVIIPYDRIGIAMIDDEGGNRKLYSEWMKSKLPTGNLGVGYSGPLDDSSLEKVLAEGQPRIINDLIQYGLEKPESESTKLALKDGIRSSLTCPLYLHKKPMGIVFFSSGKTESYSTEHIATYLEIADELAFIIAQDRIRQEAAGVKSTSQNVRMLLHDLKSPLGVIQGFLQIAQDEAWYDSLDQDAKKIFSTLERNAFHMSQLLGELAELSQLNFQKDKTEVCEVVLRNFISELEIVGRDLASKKSIKFEVSCARGIPETACLNPLKIRRVTDNLLSNAIKYSPRQTTVSLSISCDEGRLHFEVSDQGLGIPEKELPKLFREFGKTSVRPTDGESSSGMGLAIAKKIVGQHGGQISVCSQVGQGSTFSFWIPVK
jgi:signal transduction histidine kinase